MPPETLDLVGRADDDVRAFITLREPREGRKHSLVLRLKQRGVADERDTDKPAACIATAVERAAIERTLKAVVRDESAHHNRVHCVGTQEGDRKSTRLNSSH